MKKTHAILTYSILTRAATAGATERVVEKAVTARLDAATNTAAIDDMLTTRISKI